MIPIQQGIPTYILDCVETNKTTSRRMILKKSKLSTSQKEDEQRRHFTDVLGSRRSVGRVNLRVVKKRLMFSRISVTRSAEFINGVEVKRREPSIGNDVIEYTYEKTHIIQSLLACTKSKHKSNFRKLHTEGFQL